MLDVQSADKKGIGSKGQTRRSIYAGLYAGSSSSFSGDVPMDELLYEPFYQLMRLRFLAGRMVRKRELDIAGAKVVVVVPDDNTEYGERITSPSLAARFPQYTTVPDVTRATLKTPDEAFATICPLKLVEAVERECYSDVAAMEWVAYQRERYGV